VPAHRSDPRDGRGAELATLPPPTRSRRRQRGSRRARRHRRPVSALQTEGIRGAALDVTDPEPLPSDHVLWELENCLITPHTGGHTPKHWDRLADIVADNVAALDAGDELENAVVTPE